MSKQNTWQSFGIGTSNLTDKEVAIVEKALNKACKKIEKKGITIESCGGCGKERGKNWTYIVTDSGEF